MIGDDILHIFRIFACQYRLVQKKGPVLLSTGQAQTGRTFSQLSSFFFARPCTSFAFPRGAGEDDKYRRGVERETVSPRWIRPSVVFPAETEKRNLDRRQRLRNGPSKLCARSRWLDRLRHCGVNDRRNEAVVREKDRNVPTSPARRNFGRSSSFCGD